MTNPFAAAAKAPIDITPAEDPAPPTTNTEPPVKTRKADPAPADDKSFGDPFADPVGVGDGERITEFVDRLLLVKPTEYVREMSTKMGKTDAVRVDLAVLDGDQLGQVAKGVLLFQTALKREAKQVLDGPSPYLLGRLVKTVTSGGNTLYLFEAADDDDKNRARQFLAVSQL